jgi:hypothetical protein
MWKHKSSSGASHTNTWRCDDDFAAKEAVVEIVVAVVFVVQCFWNLFVLLDLHRHPLYLDCNYDALVIFEQDMIAVVLLLSSWK